MYKSRDVEAPTRAGSRPVRIYQPGPPADFPTLMYMHGGGFATGDLDMHDNYLRILCSTANIQIISVDYRLAPEHPYPAAFNDCVDVWDWIQTKPDCIAGDLPRLAIGGDSAGGTLSFAVSLHSRDTDRRMPDAIICAYGACSMTISNPELASAMLTVEGVERYLAMYAPDAEAAQRDPYCMPEAAQSLSGLPATLVISAEVDLVRDSVEHFGHRLSREGIDATVTRYPGVPHGFFTRVGILPEADEALVQTVAFLGRTIGAEPIAN